MSGFEYKGYDIKLTRDSKGHWRYSWHSESEACQCYTVYETRSEARQAAIQDVEELIELEAHT